MMDSAKRCHQGHNVKQCLVSACYLGYFSPLVTKHKCTVATVAGYTGQFSGGRVWMATRQVIFAVAVFQCW